MKTSSWLLLMYNTIRFGIKKTIKGDRFRFHLLCFVKPSTKIIVGRGEIDIGKSIAIESYGYLSAASGGKLSIGSHTFINRNCYIGCRNKISIGNNCFIGPNVSIYDHNHKFDYQGVHSNEYLTSDVVIEDGCWIGDGAKILKGAYIGAGSIIGAGTVVSSTIRDHSIVKPGKLILTTLDKLYKTQG